MNQRLRARAQKETPATANRSRSLEGLGTTLRLRLPLALVNVLVTCHAPILPCPHFRPWPQVSAQPLLQARHCTEVREDLPGQHAVHGQPVHARLALDRAQGQPPLRQRRSEPKYERLRVASAGRGSRFEGSRGPLASGDVLAGCGVPSRPRHGLRLPNRPCAVPPPCYGNGYYRNHSGRATCRDISSSEVMS